MSADHPQREYPSEIGKAALRALESNGLSTYEQLTRMSEAELLSLHGVGPKAVRILRERLVERGQGFRPE